MLFVYVYDYPGIVAFLSMCAVCAVALCVCITESSIRLSLPSINCVFDILNNKLSESFQSFFFSSSILSLSLGELRHSSLALAEP